MKKLFEKSVAKAMSYRQYLLLSEKLAAEGRTTGEQTAEKIRYTNLNFSRMKRIDKTVEIQGAYIAVFKNMHERQTWLVICEPWCGDAAHTLPYLNKIAQLSPNIDLKIVLRDENLELMDSCLTNGSRSIPILLMLDEDLNLAQTFGPRSKAATKLVDDYKENHGTIDDAFKERLQIWYNNDKGLSILNDILEKIEIMA